MRSHANAVGTHQTSPQVVPSPPAWFGELTVIAHFLNRLPSACTLLFGGRERLLGGAAQGPIRLKDKVSPRETACFPGRSESRRAIARGRGLLLFGLRSGGSKLGGSHRGSAPADDPAPDGGSTPIDRQSARRAFPQGA